MGERVKGPCAGIGGLYSRPALIRARCDAHRRIVQSSPKGRRGETLRRATQCSTHSKLAGFYRKGRGRGLCDLLADVSSEKGLKECFSEGEISETSF